MTTQQVPKLAYRPDEAMQALGISRNLLYELINDGRLPSVKLNGRRLIPVASVEALLEGARHAFDRD